MKVMNIVIDEQSKTITLLNEDQPYETEYEKAVAKSLEIAYLRWHKELEKFLEEHK